MSQNKPVVLVCFPVLGYSVTRFSLLFCPTFEFLFMSPWFGWGHLLGQKLTLSVFYKAGCALPAPVLAWLLSLPSAPALSRVFLPGALTDFWIKDGWAYWISSAMVCACARACVWRWRLNLGTHTCWASALPWSHVPRPLKYFKVLIRIIFDWSLNTQGWDNTFVLRM